MQVENVPEAGRRDDAGHDPLCEGSGAIVSNSGVWSVRQAGGGWWCHSGCGDDGGVQVLGSGGECV